MHSEDNTTQSPIHGTMEMKQNHKYYLDYDPMAVFLVEGQLFRVHRHFLMQGSAFFRKLFNSQTEEGAPDVSNHDLPIPLQEVTAKEFESLLDYLYRPPHQESAGLTLEVYLDLLHVSRQFLFDDIIQFSLQGLETLVTHVQPADRLLLGDKYGLEGWTSSACTELLSRSDSLTEKEAEALGYERLIKFIADRDRHLARQLVAVTEQFELQRNNQTPIMKKKKKVRREMGPDGSFY